MNPFYEKIITERDESCFKADIEDNFNTIGKMLSGSRIALVGAAGSIGSSVVKTILRFAPMWIMDPRPVSFWVLGFHGWILMTLITLIGRTSNFIPI